MKYPYYIITDATSDFPEQYLEEEFFVIPMTYVIDGKIYDMNNALSPHEFYQCMRDGAMPTTSLINTHTAIEYFTPVLEKGYDIFFVCFSSALSGTYKSMLEAKEELAETFPDRKIYILDSKCAASGEGLLAYHCLRKRNEGASFNELIAYAEDLKNHVHQDFTVDNLMHLYRGGRLSRTSAIVGTAMQVKPMLIVDSEGRLTIISKVVGRKLALKALLDKMEEKSKGYDNSSLVIVEHADCLEDGLYVKQKIEERFGYPNVILQPLGEVIGTHTGPNMLFIAYLASDKEK